jgi:hypothetical protein
MREQCTKNHQNRRMCATNPRKLRLSLIISFQHMDAQCPYCRGTSSNPFDCPQLKARMAKAMPR